MSQTNSPVVEALVDNHRRFLAFVRRRVGDPAAAEEILQSAFVKGLERSGSLRARDSSVAWFYRLLRNALVDHYRRAGTESRLFSSDAREPERSYEPELRGEICACLRRLLPALRPDYADMIERVDLKEQTLSEAAEQLGVSRNNATVRLHRARAALKKQLLRSCGSCATHGCLDCGCKPPLASVARSRGTLLTER